jgi:hypothetical protein
MITHVVSQDVFLDRPRLADRWKCSIETIKRRERAGVLTAILLGRLVRYRLSDIEAIEAAGIAKRKTPTNN